MTPLAALSLVALAGALLQSAPKPAGNAAAQPAAAPAAARPAAPPVVIPKRLPLPSEVAKHPGLIASGSFAPDVVGTRLDAKGGSFKLSDHVGPTSKPGTDGAIVAFMASWCGICHTSYPTLAALKAEHGERLLLVIVSTDVTLEAARKEAEKVAAGSLAVPVVHGDAATLSAWLGEERGVPRYFFVNKIGEVLMVDRGFGAKVAPLMPKQVRFTLSHPEYVPR